MSSSARDQPPPVAESKSSLTISKICAGAGAAATTAVAGSMFGADGTVVGAAVGSVVSAITTATYERSLDRTRNLVVARVRSRGGGDREITQVMSTDALAPAALSVEVTQVIPVQRPGAIGPRLVAEADSVGASLAPALPPRRTRLPLLAGATIVIFLAGLAGVTGIELLTGGPVLSSHTQRGTSVGTVLGVDKGAPSSTTAQATPSAAAESSAAATASAPPTSTKRSGATTTRSNGRSDAGSSASATPTAAARASAVPTSAVYPPALPGSGGG